MAAIDFELTDEQRLIRETARDFANEEVAPRARDSDRAGRLDTALVAKLGAMGFIGAILPERYGGRGIDYRTYALIVEEIGRADSSARTVISVNTSLVGSAIDRWGSEEQKQRLLPGLCTGEAMGCFGLTEPDTGSDAANLKTRAEKVDGGWRITGQKQWISLGNHAAFALIFAQTEPGSGHRGLAAFAVPTSSAGFSSSEIHGKLGMHASDTAELSLDGVEVCDDALIGAIGEGFKVAMSALDSGRFSVAAGCVGICQGSLDAALAYAGQREQFGRPIAAFQLVQAMIADIVLDTEAARALLWKAAWLKDAGRPNTTETSVAKLFASEAAIRCANAAIQVHGGSGYVDDHPVERYLRDARVTTLYEGTSQIQKLIIGRAMTGVNAMTDDVHSAGSHRRAQHDRRGRRGDDGRRDRPAGLRSGHACPPARPGRRRPAAGPRVGLRGAREARVQAAAQGRRGRRRRTAGARLRAGRAGRLRVGDLLAALSELGGEDCVLATNTSSIPVTALAGAAARPGNVVGMHFFNPPPLMALLEVVRAQQTGDHAAALARATGEAMGKHVIEAADGPGFLVNRCGRPFGAEALRIVQERLATPAQVDRICRVGGGFRMGPFELMDLVGIDVGLDVARSFAELSFGEPRWRPSPLQAQKVAAGTLGRKTGSGWYEYGEGGHRPEDPEPLAPDPPGGANDAPRVRLVGAPAELRDRALGLGLEIDAADGPVLVSCRTASLAAQCGAADACGILIGPRWPTPGWPRSHACRRPRAPPAVPRRDSWARSGCAWSG